MLQEMDSVSSASKESISSISTYDDSDTTSINEYRYNKLQSNKNTKRAIFKLRKIQKPKSEHLPNEITTIKNLRDELVKYKACVYLEKSKSGNKSRTSSSVNSSFDSSSSSEGDPLIINLERRQKHFAEEMEKLMKEMNYSLKNGFE